MSYRPSNTHQEERSRLGAAVSGHRTGPHEAARKTVRVRYKHLVVGVFAISSFPYLQAESIPTAQLAAGVNLATKVKSADAQRSLNVGTVTSTRRYVLRNSRWAQDAVMHVEMVSTPGVGKRYEITSMEHVGALQKRVFMKVLEGEVAVSRTRLALAGSETDTSLTASNYDFALLGTEVLDGRNCAILQLLPKKKSKLLIKGKAWVDTEAEAIVRVEGETAASVSFFIGRPAVIQHFRKVENLWLPASNRTVSDVRFLGDTEMSIYYVKYTISRSEVNIAGGSSPVLTGEKTATSR